MAVSVPVFDLEWLIGELRDRATVSLDTGCWIVGSGRGYVKHRGFPAHRLICAARLGRSPEQYEWALHSCDERRCVNPDHVSLGTPLANRVDAERNKRVPSADGGPSTLGGRIRHARERRGLTQEALGHQVPASFATVSRWECGWAVPSTARLLRVAELLGVDFAWLACGSNVPEFSGAEKVL